MFDHVSIGVRDLARAKRFYDTALRPLGYVCLSENADALGYGRDKIGLWIGTSRAAGAIRHGIKPPLLLYRAHT
jgi:catechol 2,3-dioxygenase-like lactoylglutathione lyase family enzyme